MDIKSCCLLQAVTLCMYSLNKSFSIAVKTMRDHGTISSPIVAKKRRLVTVESPTNMEWLTTFATA